MPNGRMNKGADVEKAFAMAGFGVPPISDDAPPVDSFDAYDGGQKATSAPSIELPARPSHWWRKSKDIPKRQSLLDGHYIRRNVGATIGAGGRAKTTLGVYEAVAMAAGYDPATKKPLPEGPLRIWLLNGEEDQDEIDRRIAALCQRYEISETNLGGRLYAQSVYETPLRIATLAPGGGAVINAAVVKYMEDFIAEARIDVFMIDPLISFHAVTEASNEHMDIVIKQGLGGIAKRTNSAGEAFHHPSKPKPGQAETAVEDSRGASAIINAVRSARVLNFMTPEIAKSLGISEDDRRLHVRISNGKANMAPTGRAKWIKLFPENLDNGDQIACASPWSPPDPFKGVSTKDMELARQLAQTGAYRTDPRSPDWFGYALAKQLKLTATYDGENDPAEIARIKAIIKTWRKNKVIDIEERADEQRKMRKFFVAGSFKDEPPSASAASDPDDD